MKLALNVLFVTIATMMLTSCVIVADKDWGDEELWQVKQEKNKRIIHQLNLNETRAAILEKLGEPDFSEGFSKNGITYRVLFYRTQRAEEDGNTSKNETTPLVFENDKLVGWGEQALNAAQPN